MRLAIEGRIFKFTFFVCLEVAAFVAANTVITISSSWLFHHINTLADIGRSHGGLVIFLI